MVELLKTPLYQQHQTLGGKLVDFGGWALPVNYGSQIEEHNAVRQRCGMFDVSHMTVSDIKGPQTLDFLRHLLANDIDKVSSAAGKALYSCMLNEEGGVIDDLIVYYLDDQHCRLVTNAGTREKDMAWIQRQIKPFDSQQQERPDLALIAVQGPHAIETCCSTLANLGASVSDTVSGLKRFQGAFFEINGEQEFVGRTGYTGEDGVEFIVSAELANEIWQSLSSVGVQACGLGARDTLRLEAGMALYGNDLDEIHSPIESGLKWTVSESDAREFIGKAALANPQFKMVGLILTDRGVLRGHQKVHLGDDEIGEISSGTFSPSLEKSIALARVSIDAALSIGDQVQIAVRNKKLTAVIAKYPFIKDGQPTN